MSNKTLRYLDDGSIELFEQAVSDPGENEVQVEGGACGICSWDVVTAKLGNEMHPMATAGTRRRWLYRQNRCWCHGFSKRVTGSLAAVLPMSATYPHSAFSKFQNPICQMNTGLSNPCPVLLRVLTIVRFSPGIALWVVGCGFMGLLILQGLLRYPLDDLIVLDIVQSRLDLAQEPRCWRGV